MSRRLDYATFESENDLKDAIRACRDEGIEIVDAWSPYPVHGLDELLAIRPTRLPYVTFCAAVAGVSLALWFQYWSSASDWPINVGGKPFDSLPAFLPVAFETLILLAGLATAFALFARSRLWPGRRPRCPDRRVTDDRFALLVGRSDARVTSDRVTAIWKAHSAVDSWSEDETS